LPDPSLKLHRLLSCLTLRGDHVPQQHGSTEKPGHSGDRLPVPSPATHRVGHDQRKWHGAPAGPGGGGRAVPGAAPAVPQDGSQGPVLLDGAGWKEKENDRMQRERERDQAGREKLGSSASFLGRRSPVDPVSRFGLRVSLGKHCRI